MCRLRNITLESVTDGQTDRRTDGQTDGQTDDGQSDPYVSLCFAGDTKSRYSHLPSSEYVSCFSFKEIVWTAHAVGQQKSPHSGLNFTKNFQFRIALIKEKKILVHVNI